MGLIPGWELNSRMPQSWGVGDRERWRGALTHLSFVLIFSRLYVLQGGLAQQEWRVPELLHRLLKYLEPKLTQVYKNVRERIGRWVLFSLWYGIPLEFFLLNFGVK